MMHDRFRILIACLSALAAGGILVNVAPCEEVTPDVLVKEFYAWYPCVSPSPAMDMARSAPEVAHAVLDSSRPEKDRFAAYQLIVAARLPGYKRVITMAMSDPSNEIRENAIHHLHLALPQEQLVEEYIRLLDDSSYVMRYYGAEQLAKHPSKKAVKPLLKLLADKSIETRHRAASTLLEWNDPAIKRKLHKLTRSDNVTVAGVAACSLAWALDESINLTAIHAYLEQQLLKLTGPANYGAGHVTPIIGLIAQHGDMSSLPALQLAATHENRSVQQAASDAITEVKKRIGK